MDKLKVNIGNLGEQVGTVFIPIIDKGAQFLTKRMLPAVSGFIGGMQEGTGVGGRFADKLLTLKAKASEAFGVFKVEVLPTLRDLGAYVGGTVVPTLGRMASFIGRNRDTLLPLLAAVGAGVAIFKTITSAVRIFTAVQAGLNFVMAAASRTTCSSRRRRTCTSSSEPTSRSRLSRHPRQQAATRRVPASSH